jgi:hypothetical protein
MVQGMYFMFAYSMPREIPPIMPAICYVIIKLLSILSQKKKLLLIHSERNGGLFTGKEMFTIESEKGKAYLRV